jgi:hypothetical protein
MAKKNATDFVLDNISQEFFLVSKWGCGGSTGRSEYKQWSLENASDSDIFITSVVPLKLYSTKTSGDKFIPWHNPRPSVRYCLPIRIQFKKETAELAKEGKSVVEERINKLEKTAINLEEQYLYSVRFVSHNMVLTVIDGEICIAITSTSSAQVCNVCCLRQN